MIHVVQLTPDNLEQFKGIYEDFRGKAVDQYRWASTPIDFDEFRETIREGMIHGLGAYDVSEPDAPVGLMMYVVEPHRSIELNAIHILDPDPDMLGQFPWKTIFDRMMFKFIEVIQTTPGWDCVSYPMLGIQDRFVLTAHWYGLVPVGQTIQRFNLGDELSLPILSQVHEDMATNHPLPEGYRMDTWKPEYAEETAVSIYEAFSKRSDAKWDPRFRSLEGGRGIVEMLQAKRMGLLMPECTSILLKDDTPIGFCFLIQTDDLIANIPLIGVRPSERKSGFGKQLLRHTLVCAVQQIMAEKILLTEINATVETDNYFALKMYRRMGFQEDHNYPHAYMDRDTIRKSYYGPQLLRDKSLSSCCH